MAAVNINENVNKTGPTFDEFHVSRLKEEQEKAFVKTTAMIRQWTKFREDYVTLKERLETLPHKTSYEVMVPLGKMAFMPGKLVHTNELLVLLGNDWFVERSAKEAAEISGRRILQCESTLAKLDEEKKQLENWKEYTDMVAGTANQDLVEIVEKFDAEEEKKWREKHREAVRMHKSTLSAQKPMELDRDFLSRLEELELQELEGNEFSSENVNDLFDNIGESTKSLRAKPERRGNKRVQWSDDNIKANPTSVECSNNVDKFQVGNESEMEKRECMIIPTIQSPADIYKQFAACIEPPQPKSILKPVSSFNSSVEIAKPTIPVATEQPPSRTWVSDAFSGEVVERNNKAANVIRDDSEHKPKSKFKALRQARKNNPS